MDMSFLISWKAEFVVRYMSSGVTKSGLTGTSESHHSLGSTRVPGKICSQIEIVGDHSLTADTPPA